MNKKQQKSILMIVSLIIIGGLFTGCGTSTKKAVNTTTTQVNNTIKTNDKQEELKKELTSFLTDFANAGSSFDYRKDTIEDLKRIKNFLTDSAKETESDEKYSSLLEKHKTAEGIAKVKEVKINNIENKENNTFIVDLTVIQDVISYKQGGKDYSNTVDNVSGKVAVKKVDGKFLIDGYSFQ